MYLGFLTIVSLDNIYARKGENDRLGHDSILEMSL